jgi:ABC-type hemin transport system ATPase subunit
MSLLGAPFFLVLLVQRATEVRACERADRSRARSRTSTAAARAALAGVDLGARAGELVCVIGRTAAARARCCALRRALQPSAGSVELDGRPLTRSRPRARAA